MKRILGLDLGTTSIGWAVIDQSEQENEKSGIVKMGVRVNPLTTDEKDNFEKGKSVTTTADRTLKRGMRRNLQRYKQRREHLIAILTRNGIITDDAVLCEDGNRTTFETYRLRAKAAKEEISLNELARVLLMINKKRGYKSNRKANNQEEGELIDGMAIARRLYNEHLTPGELTYDLLQNTSSRLIPSFYRSDLMAEFGAIWAKQQQYYPEILTDEARERMQGQSRSRTVELFKALCHVVPAEVKDRKVRMLTYYRWRTQSLHQKMELEAVATALVEVNGAISAASGYLGNISDLSKELEIAHMTVGEFLMSKLDADPHYRLKNRVFYRQDYLNEFETIWETQKRFHPELTDALKEEVRDTIIFYQRKLKSQKGLISFCEFESREIVVKTAKGNDKKVLSGSRVCPKSSPLYQEFKLWQTINNVIIYDDNANEESGFALNDNQRLVLHDALTYSKELKKSAILKILGLPAKRYRLNYDAIQGNTTQVALVEAYKKILEWSGHDIDEFDKMTVEQKQHQLSAVFGVLGAKTDFLSFDDSQAENSAAYKLWHLLYSYEGDSSKTGTEGLLRKIEQLTGLNSEYAKALVAVTFQADYGSVSAKAIKKILPFLKQGHLYSEACELAGYRHSKNSLTRAEIDQKQLLTALEIMPCGSLRNPVVEKILNQMIHVVNGAIAQYGPFDEIHVEMARELKQTREQREKATERIAKRTKETDQIVSILKGQPFGISNPTRNDIIRYRLYEELEPLGYKTLYTGTYIAKEKLFSRDFDIEHIIPQAKLFDDSQNNKTIETRSANLEKADQTAFDYVMAKFGPQAIDDYKARVAMILDRKKRELLLTDEEHIPSGFLNRDLSDSQYIARKATELLGLVTRRVVTTTGSITARLREDWQLIDVMKELNWEKYKAVGMTEEVKNKEGHVKRIIHDWTKRNDHRHHALDALTIAFTRPSHIQLINNVNASDGKKLDQAAFAIQRKEITHSGRFIPPMPYDQLRAAVLEHMSQILVSIKAKNKVVTPSVNRIKTKGGIRRQVTLTPRSQMHNETVFGSQYQYETKIETVGAKFDAEKISTVARQDYRIALLKRLDEFGGDPKKAFTGKNSLEKNPLYADILHAVQVPAKVKTVQLTPRFTIRRPITKDLKVDKVVDRAIREILQRRLDEFGGDAAKAFTNLDDNPIWLNKEKGIAIKSVTITGVNVATPLHDKRDKFGQLIIDEKGSTLPVDYVSTSNNHHVAIFEDVNGNWQEHIVSFFEANERAQQGLPIVDKNYNHELGWKFLFTMKRNEYFVFPDETEGFNPLEMDLQDPQNLNVISRHLYRVQKLATKNYTFRHHLETNVQEDKRLRDKTWIRVQNCNGLKGIVKVRVDHLGQIVTVGEY